MSCRIGVVAAISSSLLLWLEATGGGGRNLRQTRARTKKSANYKEISFNDGFPIRGPASERDQQIFQIQALKGGKQNYKYVHGDLEFTNCGCSNTSTARRAHIAGIKVKNAKPEHIRSISNFNRGQPGNERNYASAMGALGVAPARPSVLPTPPPATYLGTERVPYRPEPELNGHIAPVSREVEREQKKATHKNQKVENKKDYLGRNPRRRDVIHIDCVTISKLGYRKKTGKPQISWQHYLMLFPEEKNKTIASWKKYNRDIIDRKLPPPAPMWVLKKKSPLPGEVQQVSAPTVLLPDNFDDGDDTFAASSDGGTTEEKLEKLRRKENEEKEEEEGVMRTRRRGSISKTPKKNTSSKNKKKATTTTTEAASPTKQKQQRNERTYPKQQQQKEGKEEEEENTSKLRSAAAAAQAEPTEGRRRVEEEKKQILIAAPTQMPTNKKKATAPPPTAATPSRSNNTVPPTASFLALTNLSHIIIISIIKYNEVIVVKFKDIKKTK
eukprot:jgi/Bigna1/146982/aug1.126_g21690